MTSVHQQASTGEAWLAPRAANNPEEAAPEYPQASYYRARYYDPSAGRFLSEDPSWGGEDEKPNFYVYASNEPVDRFDPSGLSDLYYSSKANILILEDGNGNFVAAYAVGNNVAPGSHNDDGVTLTQPYPPRVYNFGGYNPHPEAADPDSPFGSYGIFYFPRPGCAHCGVHSGRRNKARRGRPSFLFPTRGCLRGKDDLTKKLKDLSDAGDPPKHLYVR